MPRIPPAVSLVLPLACAEACGDSDSNSTTCDLDFSASVNSGPSAGTELAGTLRLDIAADDTFTGTLTGEDGSTVGAVGSVDGYGINLVFTLSDGSEIYGVGTSDLPVHQCSGTFGGPFTGPQSGDAGDWIARAFGIDSSTPSYNADY